MNLITAIEWLKANATPSELVTVIRELANKLEASLQDWSEDAIASSSPPPPKIRDLIALALQMKGWMISELADFTHIPVARLRELNTDPEAIATPEESAAIRRAAAFRMAEEAEPEDVVPEETVSTAPAECSEWETLQDVVLEHWDDLLENGGIVVARLIELRDGLGEPLTLLEAAHIELLTKISRETLLELPRKKNGNGTEEHAAHTNGNGSD